MAIFRRVLTTARTWRSVPVRRTLNPNPPRALSPDLAIPRLLCHRSFEHQCHSSASENQLPKCMPNPNGSRQSLVFPTVLVGLAACLAAGLTALWAQMFADTAKLYAFVVSVKKRESRLQATDKKLAHALRGSYLDSKDIDISKPALRIIPSAAVEGQKVLIKFQIPSAVEGQKVSIKFQIPATRDVAQLIANIASDLGLIIESGGGLNGHCNYFFPYLCQVYWQMMLARPDKMKETGGEGGGLRIQVFRSVIPFSDRFEIEFVKDGIWSPKEVDALVSTFTLQLAGGKIEPAERQMNEFAASAD